MKTISLKLSEPLHSKLERFAKSRKQTKSDVMREALEQMLNGEVRASQGSFLEAAQRWIGCAQGPGDLSTNPKYMEGFGK